MEATRPSAHGRSVAIVLLLLVTSFAGVLSVAPRVAAATFYHSGPITANPETWLTGDTHVLYRNVTVMPTARLVIQPGVTVRADPGVRLYVRGILNADGTVAQPISFINNVSSPLVAWRGIQFNASSGGSVTRSSFDRVEQAVHAILSSPLLTDNTINQAYTGIHLERSSSFVSGNRINRTNAGIQARLAGDPVLIGNIITNLTGNPAFGIYATNLNSLTAVGNQIADAVGTDGRTPVLAGSRGTDGGSVVGILVNGTTTVTASLNGIARLNGGRGGYGQNSAAAAAGNGGDGGAAAGIVTVSSPTVSIEWNTISDLVGGRGGNGGNSSGPATPGGNGGVGGTAVGVQSLTSATSARWIYNGIYNVRAGFGGNGGTSSNTGDTGRGGAGGNAYGLLSGAAMNGNASNNLVTNVRSGSGGNSSNGPRGTTGGPGGEASGLWMLGVAGSASFLNNVVWIVTGGDGGAGRTAAGNGGNVTGIVALDGGPMFNSTTIRANLVAGLTGGFGGVGTNAGAGGGSAVGLGAVHVQLSASLNTVDTVVGGRGGDAFIIANPAGRGGDATGFIVGNADSATSSEDAIRNITKGPPGSGSGTPVSYGAGIFGIGSSTIETRITITNATLTAIGDIDISAESHTQATTVNTPFSPTKIFVATTSNLTVRNFLAVAVYWPDNVTFVNGPNIVVADDATTVYNVSPPAGLAEWLVVTDRVYVGSAASVYNNTTSVDISYGSYSFWNNPRSVDMWTTHTETFGMVDKEAPTSSAGPLSTYQSSLTFSVPYVYSDGNGTSVRNVTLWYRYNGGAWTQGPTQDVSGVSVFSFTGSADGTYEFYTVARDWAGNVEMAPLGNDTWTIVDTVRPGSHVNPLPTYETTLSFAVTWAPDAGVTDIFAYDIQVNSGTGWRDWLTGVHGTSATYTATSQGVHQFRSIAIDQAGNREPTPAGNDTWTIVDTIRPESRVNPLPPYETSLTFSVSWGPQFDSRDIATYRIQSKDGNGPWVDWIPSTDATSASFTGVDGHTYQFRSFATDLAGNVETQVPATNDTWTHVDVTPPDSVVSPLPGYVNTSSFAIVWGPVAGTSDIASYTIQSKDGTGPWTNVPGYVDTALTSGTFTAGADGHSYAFRAIARDRAGNVEIAPAGNDTWTTVDTRAPSVVNTEPVGANTNVTPWIEITFSEPMDRASTQLAFAIAPAIDGDFVWSADSTTMTFKPRTLQAGTQYTVIIGTDAMDRAGNRLAPQRTFQFTTAASAFGLGDFWWIFLIVGAAVGGTLFFIMRRRTGGGGAPATAASAKQSESIIEDVFLLNRRDGVLVRHEARRLRPDVDTDILSGMLTAVQQFVKDALRGDDYAELNEMTVGHMHILIGRGKWLVLAARIEGAGSEAWTGQIERCIKDMEDHHWDQLEDWDGDMGLARVLTPYVKKLIQGGYGLAAVEPTPPTGMNKRGKAPPLTSAR